ncbi:MAG: acyl-CoA thioesterase [Longimicrobiales bacterium]
MSDVLAGFAVTLEVPVAWGEMDAFAHVNNIVYFRWFETARIAYLDRIGFRGGDLHGGIGPILASTHCKFRRPLAYPDSVRVGARASDVGHDRFTMEYRIVSIAHEAIAAEGGGVVVAFDYTRGVKADLPGAVRSAIARLEGVTSRRTGDTM